MLIPLLLSMSLVAQRGAPPPAPATPTTEQIAEAYQLFLEGRTLEGNDRDPQALQSALDTFKKVLELTPQAAEVHAEIATVYARLGKATESVSAARTALTIDPNNRSAHRILGFLQDALADQPGQSPASSAAMKKEAVGHLEAALADGIRDPSAELSLGRLYVETGSYAKAVTRLELFLLDRPGYPEAELLIAEALEKDGKPLQAVVTLEEMVADNPMQLQARAALASLYERVGRWKDAAAAWGDLAKANPRNNLYRTRQAMASINGGDLAAGRQQLLDITAQAPRDISTWYLLAQIERRSNNPAGIEDAARKISDIDPNDPRGVLALASAKSARGDHKGAAAVLEPRVKAATDVDVANGMYGRMSSELASELQQSGDNARAVTVLEAARQRDPDDEDTAFSLASAYEKDKRFDQAEKLGRDILAKDPSNAAALNYLGYMLADRGQKLPEAVDLIKKALALEADNPSYLDSLGWAYFKSSQLGPAKDPLERAAAAMPQNSVIQDHLAELYFQLKQYRDAAATWDRALGGDREGIDVAEITKKRDRARALAGR